MHRTFYGPENHARKNQDKVRNPYEYKHDDSCAQERIMKRKGEGKGARSAHAIN